MDIDLVIGLDIKKDEERNLNTLAPEIIGQEFRDVRALHSSTRVEQIAPSTGLFGPQGNTHFRPFLFVELSTGSRIPEYARAGLSGQA